MMESDSLCSAAAGNPAKVVMMRGANPFRMAQCRKHGAELIVAAAPDVTAWFNRHAEEVGAGLARRGAGRVRFEARAGAGRGYDVVRA